MDYRQIKRVSNSDLSRLKAQLLGQSFKLPQKAVAFGSTLHETLLEPEKETIIPEDTDTNLLELLSKKVLNNKICKFLLEKSEKEQPVFFTDPVTELECKAKLDAFMPDLSRNKFVVIDYKTTATRTYYDFVKSCSRYDYDRQAAFYMDGIYQAMPELKNCRASFLFVGIQKVEPYDLYFFETEPDSTFIQTGKEKYRYLLDKWKQYGGLLDRMEGSISLTEIIQASEFFGNVA
jgi:hypothetical protein